MADPGSVFRQRHCSVDREKESELENEQVEAEIQQDFERPLQQKSPKYHEEKKKELVAEPKQKPDNRRWAFVFSKLVHYKTSIFFFAFIALVSATISVVLSKHQDLERKYGYSLEAQEMFKLELQNVQQKLKDMELHVEHLTDRLLDLDCRLREDEKLPVIYSSKSIQMFDMEFWDNWFISILISPPMYTHALGYKFHCVIVLADDYMTVVFLSVPGEFDNMLTWPAKANFTLKIITSSGDNVTLCSSEEEWKKPNEVLLLISSDTIKVCSNVVPLHKLGNYLHIDLLMFILDVV